MALPTWYSTGTVSVESGSTTVTVTGGFWGDDAIMPGDLFCDPAQPLVPPQRVKEVTGNAELELWAPWPGDDIEDGAYEIRYVGIIERSTAQTRKVLEQLGDVKAWYDVIVEDDDARLALETEGSPLRAGYRVLVKDDGVIWAKAASAYGDWIGPVEFKGDKGDKGWSPLYALVEDGDRVVFQLAGWVGGEGAAPEDDVGKYLGADGFVEDIEDAVDIRGLGFNFRGAYSGAIAYAKGDVVRDNGSAWIALQPAIGNAPPVYPTTSNSYWELIAAKGQDGTGTGDMVGPAGGGVADGDLVAFADATGKLTKKAGGVSNAQLATMANATVKGRNTAGAGAPEDVTMTQLLTLLETAGAYAKDNILGAVSQSGGVPTGAIIERGSNANGEYIRYADGTQICTGRLVRSSVAITGTGTTSGVFYEATAQTVTYPAAFLTGTVPKFVHSETSGTFMWTVGAQGTTPITATQGKFWLVAASSEASRPSDVHWIAIGRWV